jgi:hypothetical protein
MAHQIAVDHLTDIARPTEQDNIALGIRAVTIDHAA